MVWAGANRGATMHVAHAQRAASTLDRALNMPSFSDSREAVEGIRIPRRKAEMHENPRRAAATRALPERLTLAVMPGRAFRRLTSVPWLPGPIRTGPGKSVAIDNRATVTP